MACNELTYTPGKGSRDDTALRQAWERVKETLPRLEDTPARDDFPKGVQST